MSIKNRIQKLVLAFSEFDDWEDKYKFIIKMGKEMPAIPDEFRVDKNKVKGCQSTVWFHAENLDGKIIFYGDSDASIVRGIIAILIEVYSNSTSDEILLTKPDFLEEIGLREHLSMSRANGLSAILKQLSLYAIVFKNQGS